MPSYRKRHMQPGQVVFIVGTQTCYDGLEVATVIRSIHGIKGKSHGVFSTEARNSLAKHQLPLWFKERRSREKRKPGVLRKASSMTKRSVVGNGSSHPESKMKEGIHSLQHCAQDSSQAQD